MLLLPVSILGYRARWYDNSYNYNRVRYNNSTGKAPGGHAMVKIVTLLYGHPLAILILLVLIVLYSLLWPQH